MTHIVLASTAFLTIALCSPVANAHDCNVEEVADIETCLRSLKVPNVRKFVPSAVAEPAADTEAKKVTGKPPAASAADASPAASKEPAKLGGPADQPMCQKYFANIGQVITVPCDE